MTLAKLQKQLVRDLKRSPAKAGALGLLCIVAIWFWAPLVSGWFNKGGTKSPTASEPVAQAVPAMPLPAATSPPAAAASVPWKQLVEWIEKDARMRSANLASLETPPFVTKAPDLIDPGEVKQEEKQPSQTAEIDVAQLGLKLSSTMLGSRRRVAVINGRPYPEGGELQLGDDLVVTLARVDERSVLLEYEGKRFELTIAGK
jgi:hypothetical protein